jgi:hypothetical protein
LPGTVCKSEPGISGSSVLRTEESGVPSQVQDAFQTAGATPALGVELRALNVIGYTYVPQPPTFATGGTGILLVLGYWLHCRRRAAA